MVTGKMVMENEHTERKRRRKRTMPANPLQAGIVAFLSIHSPQLMVQLSSLPKRYTLYSPLLLLPATFDRYSDEWKRIVNALDPNQKMLLYEEIVKAFNGGQSQKGLKVSHVAILAPISLEMTEANGETVENVMRSPSGLEPVYGDFGPEVLQDLDCVGANTPQREDFEKAFWVTTSQHLGVVQCWAPRWTMFSRGNISEKGRILLGTDGDSVFPGLTNNELDQPVSECDIADCYIGIGYFAFSYLARGFRRVWGWDLNAWSIEGLRRGCLANGWRCETISLPTNQTEELSSDVVQRLANELVRGDIEGNPIRCVAFLGNNRSAASAISSMQVEVNAQYPTSPLNIRHANLGLLPSSQPSWMNAVQVLSSVLGGWLHIHENVEHRCISNRTQELVIALKDMVRRGKGPEWEVSCCQVNQVKTYAPGVVHCVFDMMLRPSR